MALVPEKRADDIGKLTLEQRRAADAWRRAQGCSKEYVNLAKGLPALIMNSGLMQVMAFLHEKGSSQKGSSHGDLGQHLRDWLHQRFAEVPVDFQGFMTALMKAAPHDFQMITAESFAWLRWLRQIAPAVCDGGR